MMASILSDRYQEVIRDHHLHPRNFGPLERATALAEGTNPACGDRLTVYLQLDMDKIREASFRGSGCSIALASASMMTVAVRGRKRADVKALLERFEHMLTGSRPTSSEPLELGSLEAFSTVASSRAHARCAGLAWRTLSIALDGPRHGEAYDRNGRRV